jgi:hypothetical protein
MQGPETMWSDDVLSLLQLSCQIRLTHDLFFQLSRCASQCHLIIEWEDALSVSVVFRSFLQMSSEVRQTVGDE